MLLDLLAWFGNGRDSKLVIIKASNCCQALHTCNSCIRNALYIFGLFELMLNFVCEDLSLFMEQCSHLVSSPLMHQTPLKNDLAHLPFAMRCLLIVAIAIQTCLRPSDSAIYLATLIRPVRANSGLPRLMPYVRIE